MQLFRRLFHRFRPRDASDGGKADKKEINCIIKYLDDSEANFSMPKQSSGKDLYERVYNDLDFQYEHEYFALQYTDFHNIRYWLDPTKSLKKQIKKTMPGPPFTFRFVVKFFSSEPDTYLKEELTRYLYVLQLKSDLADGRLTVTDEEKAAEMAALVIQSEEGDYEPEKHDLAFVSQFSFLPEEKQTEEFEMMVFEEYQKLVDRNLTPALCEKMYLNKVKYLDNYGVDVHKVQGKDDRIYQLGLTPAGILVYDGEEKIGFFFWQRIVKIAFNRANLKIVVTEDDTQGAQQDHTFVFKLIDARTCKHLWRCAVEHHTFFRLVQPKAPPSKTKQLLRLRSRFYHSFRTETGLVQANQFGTSQRRSARFERKPSTRHSSRPSFTRSDAERRHLRSERRPGGAQLSVQAPPSVLAEVEENDNTNSELTISIPDPLAKPETIETKAIVVSSALPDEDDVEEAEFNSFDAMAPTTVSPPARDSRGSSQLASPTTMATAASANITVSSPLPASYYGAAFNSSSGHSDSSSAFSQRTVIEVAPPPVVSNPPVAPTTQALPQEEEEALVEAPKSPTEAAAPSSRRSGLRPPTAIPKPAAAAPVAAASVVNATNGVGKSISTSALPAPKVLVQKQPPQAQQPSLPPAATVSASNLPRRLSNTVAAPTEAPAAPAVSRSEEAASRIPAPAVGAAAPPQPGRSRIPAPSQPPQPPPPAASTAIASQPAASGLPQPKAGVSGIPRLSGAPAVVGPQFSLKL